TMPPEGVKDIRALAERERDKGDLNAKKLIALLRVCREDAEPVIAAPTLQDSLPEIRNWEFVDSDGKLKRKGLALPDICHEFATATGGWPKRVDKMLFVPGGDHEPRFLPTSTDLFAWADARMYVDWAKQSDMVTQERFHAHLEESVEKYSSIEKYPHWPPFANTYYFYPELPRTNGQYLEEFVEFFAPRTTADLRLIKAFTLCLAWGGPPGARPAWLFIGPEGDHQGGRGIGKSKLIELCADLFGGMIEISPTEDIVAIKKRLLSPSAMTVRLARIDNIKTYRFSWADLESLITSPIISGHRMYQGEGRRPNTLTWAMTLNGASLSKDMAKRVMIVELRRPAYRPEWEQEVRAYIDKYRWHILNDIRLALEN
ncbi:MAG: hypothetical protein WCL32_17435, partial [Planctomycetota bacterium]